MTDDKIVQIEKLLRYGFRNKQLLVAAFTHSSYANKHFAKSNERIDDNERMAFFGDAILKTVIAEYLYHAFYFKDKGELSYMCSSLVSREGIAPVVEKLGLTKHLRIISASSAELSPHLCADLFEAVVAAIYLDGGFDSAKQFVLAAFDEQLRLVNDVERKDCKTLLQEHCQRNKLPMPEYRLVSRSGTDNNPVYEYEIYIDGEYMCGGSGTSKKSAEQDAAKKLIAKWRVD